MINRLKKAVREFAAHHANTDGIASTCVPGLRMMCAYRAAGPIRSIYRPLVCLVLQGGKQLTASCDERLIVAGEAIIVAAHLPVTGHIIQATLNEPYLAIAIEIDMGLLRTLALEIGETRVRNKVLVPVYTESLDETIVSCASRLMRLIDEPEAIDVLQPAILRELHYWLLTSRYGPELRRLAMPGKAAERMEKAIEMLRSHFRETLSVRQLAEAARLSPSAFRRHFKELTSLSPIQFQKRLRLSEARRLMLSEGLTASRAAAAVGYRSVSQFSHDFARFYGAPPRTSVISMNPR